MRNLHILSFTKNGERTARRILESLQDVPGRSVHAVRVCSLKDSVAPLFRRDNVLVFVGAVGIAVRAVAPFLKSKLTDPAVIVVDELGRFAIPILSGHLGGGNRLAMEIALKIGAVPVVTTATDLHGVFAVDVFASENGYAIIEPERIKTVSARLLDGKTIGLASDWNVVGPLPENVVARKDGEVGIHIGFRPDKNPFEKTLHLVPKCLHVGIGCRRGIPFDDLYAFFADTLNSRNIPAEAIASLSSIVLKRDEASIHALAQHARIPFLTYTRNELQPFEHLFASSDFVRSKTGVGNVCEIAAWLSAKKGEMVLNKTVRSGMTLAIARERWTVRFDRKKQEAEETAE